MAKLISKFKRPKKKQTTVIIKVVIILVAAFGVGTGLFLLQRHWNGADDKAAQQIDSREDVNRKPEGAIEESIAKAADGNYEGAQQQLESELKKTDDTEKAQQLLVQQAIHAYNQKDYAASLAYAEKAIAKVDDYQANFIAATAAEAAGQNAVAKKYFEAALAKFDKDSPMYAAEKPRLEAAIKRVSQ